MMTSVTHIDPEAQLTRVLVSGTITLAEACGLVESTRAHTTFPDTRELWDLRQTDPRLSNDDIRSIVNTAREENAARCGRAAILGATDAQYKLAKQLELIASVLACEVRVFREYNDALEWLFWGGTLDPLD